MWAGSHAETLAAITISREQIPRVHPEAMGAKLIFLTVFSSVLFGWELRREHWWAAALTTTGVFILGLTEVRPGRAMLRTTVLALLSSACFGLCDALIQQWAPDFGLFGFLPIQFATVGALSICFVPFFRQPLSAMPRPAWGWLMGGAVLTALQAMLIVLAIGLYRDATGVNVVYSTRGLWAVVLVWFLGQRLGNTEHKDLGKRLAWRAMGAVLLTGAVLLAVRAAR